MKKHQSPLLIAILSLLLIGLLIGCSEKSANSVSTANQTQTLPVAAKTDTPSLSTSTDHDAGSISKPEPTPTPHQFPVLYNCEIKMEFTSGPLEGKGSKFTVLGEEYFADKGELFYPGEKTAVFYTGPKYLILHSAFQNGNVLRPLEAEFIRFYLEYWGESGTKYIQQQIDNLIGSEIEWTCNGDKLFTTEVKEIIRLSAVASNELWQEPIYLRQILIRREGLVSEWVGEMDPLFMDTFYLGFCGWGPESSGDGRYTYYRYLINFDINYD